MQARHLALVFTLGALSVGCRTSGSSTRANSALAASGNGQSSLVAENISCGNLGSSVTVAFFDADSTLRISKKGSVSADTPTDVYILPFTATKIAELNKKNILVAVVSNQLGVSRGYITKEVAVDALTYMATQFSKLGARVDTISIATSYDEFRKPDIGMATELFDRIKTKCGKSINMPSSFMVGDSAYMNGDVVPPDRGRPADNLNNVDRLFAEKLNIEFHEPADYFDWRAYNVFNIKKPDQLREFISVLESKAPAEAANMKKINQL